MSELEMREAVKSHVATFSSLREAAKAMKISPAYLSDVCNGRRHPGDKVIGPLGYEQIVTVEYRKKS